MSAQTARLGKELLAAADMLHQCADECIDCDYGDGATGKGSEGGQCEECRPVREAEKRARDLLSIETSCDSDAEVFTRAVVAGVARWEFFSGSDDNGEVCVGGLRYATRLNIGVPVLGPALRTALERHTIWKQHPQPVG
jgi:hypothetical protein